MANLDIREQYPLANLTTMKLGGPGEHVAFVKSIEDIQAAQAWARERSLPITCIGGGSNTIIRDEGITGLVIVFMNDQLVWDPPYVTAGAGVKLGQLIAGAAAKGLGGLSWLLGVPGTVGGSIYGNAGGKDITIGQYVDWVDVLDHDGSLQRLSQADCGFSYRHSQFKVDKRIIVQARLKLPEVDPAVERANLAAMAKTKNANQPTTAQSAGCMFANPTVEIEHLPPDLQPYVLPNQTISAWRLIDHLGLKGHAIGGMKISEQHGNFLLNTGTGTADQAVQLISLVKQQVRDTLGIQLREEVQYLGF